MNLQSSSGEAEASGSQANNNSNHRHHHHHHHHARLEEHDYIGMSEQQVYSNATPKSAATAKSKELNMRRTELQLGLPGSPVEDEETGPFSATMQLKKSLNGGLVNSTNNNNANTNSNSNAKLLDDKDKEKDGANARPRGGGGVGSSSSSSSCHLIKQQPVVDETPDCVEKQETRAPVGWPPVQSFRKNSLNAPGNNNNTNTNNNSANTNNNNNNNSDKVSENTTNPGPSNPAAVPPAGTSATPTPPSSTTSQFVKVYMDGVPIGRKVNLRTHSSYDKLSAALEEMFKRFINGQSGSNKAMKEKVATECKKFNFIYGSDYVLTYEDKDGDLMLVGDVPWVMFVGTVKRLRIMKGSEAIGLAPRDQQPSAAPAAPATTK